MRLQALSAGGALLRRVLSQELQSALTRAQISPKCCTTSWQQQQLSQSHGQSPSAHAVIQQAFRRFASSPATKNPARKAVSAATTGGARQTLAEVADPSPGLSPFERWWKAFKSVPNVPKVLGLTGAIPFIVLAPPVCKHLTHILPAELVDNCALFQVCYGAGIVSFLGAVHWGVAMSSSLSSPVALRIANESFIYSVIPAIAATPVPAMEPGAGAILLSILLPACYLADYSRRNLGFPMWYMALRAPLTLLATFGMLLTATRHVHSELDRAKQIAAAQAGSKPSTSL